MIDHLNLTFLWHDMPFQTFAKNYAVQQQETSVVWKPIMSKGKQQIESSNIR